MNIQTRITMTPEQQLKEASELLQTAEQALDKFIAMYPGFIKMVFTGENPQMEKVMRLAAHKVMGARSDIAIGHLDFNIAGSCLDIPIPDIGDKG